MVIEQRHLQEWTEGSGVSEEITRLNIESLDAPKEIDYRLNRNKGGKGKNPWQHGPGWWVSGVDPRTGDPDWLGGQFKPDIPVPDERKSQRSGVAKYTKYLGCLKQEAAPLFLAHPDPEYWQKVLKDASIPIAITEGAKKAGKLITAGIAAISLPGVACGQKGGLLRDLLKIFCQPGRVFYQAFDADLWIKPDVYRELSRLSLLMTEAGTFVRILDWHDRDKEAKGIDDYLAKHGDRALDALTAAALPFSEWQAVNKQRLPAPTMGKAIEQSEFAQMLAEDWQDRVKYDCRRQEWLRYDPISGIWLETPEDAIATDLYEEASRRLGKGFGFPFLSGSSKLLRINPRILENGFKAAQDLLVFRNGALDLETNDLLPHSAEHRARWSLQRDYDPEQSNWEPIARWLVKSLADPLDQDRVVCFHAALLRKLFGKIGGKNILMQRGPSGSGRSTSNRLATEVIGQQNLLTINSIESLEKDAFPMDQEGVESQPQLIVFPDNSKLAPNLKIDTLLALTGRDWVRINIKNKSQRKILYDGGVIINSTETVFSRYHLDRGMERRCVFVGSWRKDAELKTIEKEFTDPCIAAYTNFLLSLPEDLIIDTLREAPGSATIAQQAEDDPMVRWFASHIEITNDPSDRIQLGRDISKENQLYGNYFKACRALGVSDQFIKKHNSFTDEFRRIVSEGNQLYNWKVEEKMPQNKRTFLGLRFKADPDDSTLSILGEETSKLDTRLDPGSNPVRSCNRPQTLIQQALVSLLDPKGGRARMEGQKFLGVTQDVTDPPKNTPINQPSPPKVSNHLTDPGTASIPAPSEDLTGLDLGSNLDPNPTKNSQKNGVDRGNMVADCQIATSEVCSTGDIDEDDDEWEELSPEETEQLLREIHQRAELSKNGRVNSHS